MTISKLTAGVAAGEAAMVERFYRLYFDRLLAVARSVTRRDESFCLDVVQDAMLRVVRTIRVVSTEAQLDAWLVLVVRTTAYDLLKSERRRSRRQTQVAILAGHPADEITPEFDPDERLAWLKQQLDAMDPQLVKLIELRYRQDWTLARIGSMFGLSAGTVDGRLRRAIATLRKTGKTLFDE